MSISYYIGIIIGTSIGTFIGTLIAREGSVCANAQNVTHFG